MTRHEDVCPRMGALLYVLVGFVAGACPSSPDRTSPAQSAHHPQHHQPNTPATHALACAWACHASANQSAIDVLSHLALISLVAAGLFFSDVSAGFTQRVWIFARPPPRFFA
jgi:hypothetical protein